MWKGAEAKKKYERDASRLSEEQDIRTDKLNSQVEEDDKIYEGDTGHISGKGGIRTDKLIPQVVEDKKIYERDTGHISGKRRIRTGKVSSQVAEDRIYESDTRHPPRERPREMENAIREGRVPKKITTRGSGVQNDPEAKSFEHDHKIKRGCALVICNSFKGSADFDREESNKIDVENMRNLWQGTPGCELFDGIIHVDQGAEEMRLLLKRLSRSTGYDYIVVVIDTHGGLFPEEQVSECEDNDKTGSMVQVFLGNDEKPVRERELKEYFFNSNAKGLQHVKKFFILDYCRGGVEDLGAPTTPWRIQLKTAVMMIDNQYQKKGGSSVAENLMPTISDILIVYASQYSFAAIQHNGSWLISAIAKVFKKYAKKKHVVDMLTMVNKEMKRMFLPFEKEVDYQYVLCNAFAMSVFESSLVDDFYL